MEIDTTLVRALLRAQFPHWADLPVAPVPRQGWDNRTFRVGSALSARLPSAEQYAAAVGKEETALRALSGRLPVAVPEPVAVGRPGSGYPHPWSVRRWLAGETPERAYGVDRLRLASDLGAVLTALRAVPAAAGTAAGRHSHYRGCPPSVYGDQVEAALRTLGGAVDGGACGGVWRAATTSAWPAPPVWLHGDVAVGNLLVESGRLSALIDFGGCAVGDPACDLTVAWTYFRGPERAVFRDAAGLDDDAWARARGWALWKALATMAGLSSPDPAQERVLGEVLADPVV